MVRVDFGAHPTFLSISLWTSEPLEPYHNSRKTLYHLIARSFEMEIRELLSSYQFPGDEIPIIKGSALAALEDGDPEIGKNRIKDLMDAVDSYIPQPERPVDRPFLMPIEDVFSISGRGTVIRESTTFRSGVFYPH